MMTAFTKTMKTRTLYFFLWLILPVLSHAMPFSTLSTSEGLSNRRAIMGARDADGYIWFATRTGIDRYDGEKFRSYLLKNDLSDFPENPRGIICGLDGTVVAYAGKGVYWYSVSTDAFSLDRDIKTDVGESISVLAYDPGGNLWIGTTHNLYVLKPGSAVMEKVIENTAVYSIAFENTVHGWVGTSSGVCHISGTEDGRHICKKENIMSTLEGKRVQSLLYDAVTRDLWIGTFESGVFLYDKGRGKLLEVDTGGIHLPVRSISAVGQNNIWVGVDGAGIFEYSRFDGTRLAQYSQNDSGRDYIVANSVYHILDSGNNVWICTYTNGVMAFSPGRMVSDYYAADQTGSSLRNNYVNCVMEDSRGRIWMGTNDGVSRYDGRTGKWKHFLNISSDNVVLSLCEDSQGNVWMGGYACDAVYVDDRDEEHVFVSSDGQRLRYIYTICEDSGGAIWLGGILNGMVCRYPDGRTRRFNIRGLNHILEYNSDTLLLATNSGVFFFDKISGNLNAIQLKDSPDFLNTAIQRLCIVPEEPDRLWIGTESRGVVLYETGTGNYVVYNADCGLSSDSVCSLQSDNQGRMWVGTENGLNCISFKHGYIENFYEPDGLPDKTMNLRAHCRLSNGHLMWGTPSGAYEMNPDEYIWKEDIPYNLRFEEFALFNTPVVPSAEGSPLTVVIDKTQTITLRYDQNSFSFRFLNLGYQSSRKYQYSWFLEGFDRQWCNPSDHHHAVYTNIPPGKYTFRARVQRASGDNDFCERAVEIVVRNPWWTSWYAIILYLTVAGFVVYVIVRFYKSRLEARDSDQKIRFFVNLAHDIRTPLTLVKAPLTELYEEPLSDNGRNALELAQRNTEKLMNMVSQLLDFQKLEREAMTLQVERTDLESCVREVICDFEPLASEKDIRINVDVQVPEGLETWIDRRKLSIIMDNLISNAIKYTPNGGNIWVKCRVDSKSILTLEITDDGIGISQADQGKLFNRFYRGENAVNSKETGSGIGLLLTKKMTLLHKGDITFHSTLGAGTTFCVRIPVVREKYSSAEVVRQKTGTAVSESQLVANAEPDRKKKPVLLVVEDNEELRKYLAHYFASDYRVIEGSDGQEALDLTHKENPDFIVSDVMMPVLSGMELCRRLKADIETCHIPLILLTSLAEREDIIKGLNAGADDYVTKPFDPSVLKSKIASIMNNRDLYRRKFIDKSAFVEESPIIGELDRKFMERVVEYIEENLVRDDLSIDIIAMEMAMSRSVFFKKIKSLTGQSPQDFVRDIKMKKAASLLQERKYSIGEIAYLTGYPNAKYFSTAFKKYYGCTPTEYVTNQ